MSHLLVALSSHGYGHVAQTAPVVNALRIARPALELTLQTLLPYDFLAARFVGDFVYEPRETDVGMAMASAIEVKAAESQVLYERFHEDWARRVREEARWLEALRPDLVLANVPYRVLAAAAQAGIPAVAMCSLNWFDIYRHYAAGAEQEDAIAGQILDAYRSAEAFLRLTPGMPMADLANVRPLGTVARIGRPDRHGLRAQLGLSVDARVVMIAPGGIELRLPIERWPPSNVHWIVPASWSADGTRVSAFESLGSSFVDVLAACDAVVGKPGYGTFAEAACNGVPILYVRRSDWPEEPVLVDWIHRHALALEIPRATLVTGRLSEALERLWAMPAPTPPRPAGIAEAVEFLAALLPAR